MCRNARSNQAAALSAAAEAHSPMSSPRYPVNRPTAPTPEQTNHWLHGMDQAAERGRAGPGCSAPRAGSASRTGHYSKEQELLRPGEALLSSRSGSPDSPRTSLLRPRSPTPTKMLAWEEARSGRATACQSGAGGSPGDSDHEGRGDQTDGLIAQLIGACQVNEINKAITFYEKLRRMQVPLYEGVYKMIIECCMRTQQLGHAMQFYETLKGSGQRVSSRLAVVLMEACAKEQHGDKVHAIWSDWCPSGEPIRPSDCEVLLVAVSALIRTMSPDLARDVLKDAMRRSGDDLAACLADAEIELEELVQLNEQVAEEAKANGTLLEELAGRFGELHALLDCLLTQSAQSNSGKSRSSTRRGDELLFMEDVDLDLELAAM